MANKHGGKPGKSAKKMPNRMRSSTDAAADTFKPSTSGSVKFGGGFDGKARKGGSA